MFITFIIFTWNIRQDEEIQNELKKQNIEFYAYTGNIIVIENKNKEVLERILKFMNIEYKIGAKKDDEI